jgi:hypothetical protein
VSARPYVERQKAPPSAAGVPPKGAAKPSPHERAILRRAALGFIMVTLRGEGEPPLYCYESGEVIRGQGKRHDRGALSEAEFRRLSQWLVPERDALFPNGPPQRWDAKKPGGPKQSDRGFGGKGQ